MAASGSGPLLNERIRPKARMTAGITNGIRVTNSTTGRSRGRRSRTQYAVGTIRSVLTTIVIRPMTNE